MERVSKNRVNDPFRGRNIGRRTGKAIEQLKSGVADFDAYLSESDADLTLDVTKPSPAPGWNSNDLSQEKCDSQEEQTNSPCVEKGNDKQTEGSTRILRVTNPFINPRFGRRTGKDILAKRKIGSLSSGVENFSNFLSDCDSSVSLCPTPVKSPGTDGEKLSPSVKQSDDEDETPSAKQPVRQRKTPVFKLSQNTEPLNLHSEEPLPSPLRRAETRHSVPVLELSGRKSKGRENFSVEEDRRNERNTDESTYKKGRRSKRISSALESKNVSGIANIAADGLLEVDMNVVQKNVHKRRSSHNVDKSVIADLKELAEENVISHKTVNRSKVDIDSSCTKSVSEQNHQNIEIDVKAQKQRMSQGQLSVESEEGDDGDVAMSRSRVCNNDISTNTASNLDGTNMEDSPLKEKNDLERSQMDDGDMKLDKEFSNMTRRSNFGSENNPTKIAVNETHESEDGNRIRGNRHTSRSHLDGSKRVQNRSRSNDSKQRSANQSQLGSQSNNGETSDDIQGSIATSALKQLNQLHSSQTNHSVNNKEMSEHLMITSDNETSRTSIQSPHQEQSKKGKQKYTSRNASMIDKNKREDHNNTTNVMGKSHLDAEVNRTKNTSKQSIQSLGDSRSTQKERRSRISSGSGQSMLDDKISKVKEEDCPERISISHTSDENGQGKTDTRKAQKQQASQSPSCLDNTGPKHDKEASIQVNESWVDANSVSAKLGSKPRRKSSRNVSLNQKHDVSKSLERDSSGIKCNNSVNKLSSSHLNSDSSGTKTNLKENQVGEKSLQLQQTLNSVPKAYMTTSGKESLNFGGDITGSVSHSEKASSEHFYGIKKRLTFSNAMTENDVKDSVMQVKEKALKQKEPQMSFVDSHTAHQPRTAVQQKPSQPLAAKAASSEEDVENADFNIIDSDSSARNGNMTKNVVLGENKTKGKRLSSIDDKSMKRRRKRSPDISEPSPKHSRNADDSTTVTRKSIGLRSVAKQRLKSNSVPFDSSREEIMISHKESPDLPEHTGDKESSVKTSSLKRRKLRSKVLPERNQEKPKSTKTKKVSRKSVREKPAHKGNSTGMSVAKEKQARLSCVSSYEDEKSTLQTSNEIRDAIEVPLKSSSSKNPHKNRRTLSQKFFLPRRSSVAGSFVRGERSSPVRLSLLNTLPRVTPRSGISFRSRSRVFEVSPATKAELELEASHSDCTTEESTPLRPNARQRGKKPKKKRLVDQMTDESGSLQEEPEDEMVAGSSSQVDSNVVHGTSPLPGTPLHTGVQQENQRIPTSCLKSSNRNRRSIKKESRRVRISDVFQKKDITPPTEDENEGHSGNQSSVYPDMLSLTSSPVHYFETTTSSILGSPQLEIPNLDYKIVRPENAPPGVRRSKRTRVLRLNRDRGEGIIYKRDSTGFCLEVDSIQPSIGEAKLRLKEEKMRRMRRKKKIEATKLPQMKKKRLSSHLSLQNDVTVSTELPVINPDTNEEVLVELIGRAEDAKWAGPDLDALKGSEKLAIGVHLNQPGFSSGQFHIGPLGKKPEELVIETLVFSITHGKICVTINGVSTVLETGDHFFIPRGTSYSMENVRRDVARLCFVCLQNLRTMPAI